MKKFYIFKVLVFSIAALLGTPAVADPSLPGTALYVQSAKAKLLESPNFNAKVVASVPRGNTVEVVSASESWIKVRFNDQVGWVSKLVLSANPPIDKKSVLQGDISNVKQNARRRASNTATAAATRGLRLENRSPADDKELSDYGALKQVESTKVDVKEVQEFSQQKQSKPTQ